jgi:hypothetical protein
MSGLVLLIIGLASLALVVAFVAVVALKGWRLFKTVRAVSRSSGALAFEVAGRAQRLELNVGRLQANATQLQASLTRLQATADRLRVLFEALGDAVAPYRSVRTFFGR